MIPEPHSNALTASPPAELFGGLFCRGERPAGEALTLLEQAQAASEADPDNWCVLDAAACLSLTTALRALARAPLDPGTVHWVVDCLKELAFFIPEAEAREWERQGAWRSELSDWNKKEYERYLSGESPSAAYLLTHDSNRHSRHEALVLWARDLGPDRLRAILNASADRWEAWAPTQPGYRPHPLCERARHLGVSLGYGETLGLCCGLLELLADVAPQPVTWVNLMSWVCAGQPARLLELWGVALGVPTAAWSAVALPGSPWVDLGLIKPVGKTTTLADLQAHSRSSWDEVWRRWSNGGANREWLSGDGDVMNAFAQPLTAPVAQWTLPAWTEQWRKALAQSNPVRLLVCGPFDGGGTELVARLLADTGTQGWVPSGNLVEHLRQARGSGEERPVLQRAASIVRALGKRPGTVLVARDWGEWASTKGPWENAPTALALLKETGGHQIWFVPHLSAVPAAVRACFHDIRIVEPPAVDERCVLARQWFPTPLANRVGRAVAEPGRLRSLGEWCQRTDSFDWRAIAERLSAEEQAERLREPETARRESDVRVMRQNLEDLPPLGGYPEAMAFLDRTRDAFDHPERYRRLGARLPRGVLLRGLPGCGKTLLARHLAARIDVPLLVVETAAVSQDVERLKAVFGEARRHAPCVLFFDEADILIADPASPFGTDLRKQRIVNTMLAEIDGVNTVEGVFVVAASHREVRIDPALIRSGRLSESLHLDVPGPADREAIWAAHLARRAVAEDVSAPALASGTQGFTGADIDEAVNRAALFCARRQADAIDAESLNRAADEIYWGLPTDSLHLQPEERWNTAVHEAGHALVAWAYGFRVPRITIRPRRHALGMTQWQRQEGIFSLDRDAHVAQMALALGGMAAEQHVFGRYGNGGVADLKHVRALIEHIRITGQADLNLSVADPERSWSERRLRKTEALSDSLLAEGMERAQRCLEAAGDAFLAFARDVLDARELSGRRLDEWAQQFAELMPAAVSDAPERCHRPVETASPIVHTVHRERSSGTEAEPAAPERPDKTTP